MKKVTIFFFVLVLLVGCGSKQDKKLEKTLFEIIGEEENTQIDIAEMTKFSWDKAFLFEPYTNESYMSYQLGVDFKDRSNLDWREDIYLLVFLYEDKVTKFIEIERQRSTFHLDEGRDYLTPEDAIIYINRLE
ncbi:MAG: hypothetical protein ACK4M9_19305 [Anaerobacillus sp.]|uniref:hypothetical protein n=1 Tax=Anaerobacillus sp. TaxID=1872506 RepID=UPI00391AEBA9